MLENISKEVFFNILGTAILKARENVFLNILGTAKRRFFLTL